MIYHIPTQKYFKNRLEARKYFGSGEYNRLVKHTSDFIFINDKAKAHKYRVCKDKINGNYSSDHFAIWADLEY